MTPALRMQLRSLLSPRVAIRPKVAWSEVAEGNIVAEQDSDFVDWEIVLAADHPHTVLRDELLGNTQWQAVLPTLLVDAESLLRSALDLKRELGGADDRSDGSYSAQPSISHHTQNRDFHDWTVLIEDRKSVV